MAQVIHVQNPRALLDPSLRSVVLEAVDGTPLGAVEPETLFEAVLGRAITGPGALFVALQAGEYRGVALALPSQDPLDARPRVLFHMRRGSKKGLKSGLLLALVDFLCRNHYTKVWAINPSGVRDSVFKRAWKKAGKSRKVASVMEVDLAA